MVAKPKKLDPKLRVFALSLPAAQEAFPWGEVVVKVSKKVFVFLGRGDPLDLGAAKRKRAEVEAWIEESYRAVATKSRVADLDAQRSGQ